MGKKVAVLIRDKDNFYEGLRSSLGLCLEDHIVSMFVLNHEVDMTEEYEDNMGFLEEMEGKRYSNIDVNCEKYRFKWIDSKDIGSKIKENDLVIPF